MGFDIQALKIAINNEFLADADLLNALGGSEQRMYPTKAPQNPNYPYAVYKYITGVPDPTFNTDGEIVQISFSMFHKSEDPLDSTTIDDVFKKLTAAFDDTTLTITGYTSIGVTRGTSNEVETVDDTQQYVVDYEVMIEES